MLTRTIRSGATPRVSLQMYSNASVSSASPARMATSSPYTYIQWYSLFSTQIFHLMDVMLTGAISAACCCFHLASDQCQPVLVTLESGHLNLTSRRET